MKSFSVTISKIVWLFILAALAPFLCISPLYAQSDEDKKLLLMYFSEEELTVESATRSPKPVSRTAENVTIVTAGEIELMNAHTVADALSMITGIQIFSPSGPGNVALPFIQGSEPRHVTVFIDGIPLNNLSDNVSDLGMLPVQNIEKIEIIKGPASSAWGSALGGVVNIITKSAPPENRFSGTASGSIGERETGDFRAESSGRQGAFGYYFNAGRLQTDGIRPGFEATNENAYAKLSYDVGGKTRIEVTANYTDGERGAGDFPEADISFSDEFSLFRSSFLLNTVLNRNADFTVRLWSNRQKFDLSTSLYFEKILLAKDHLTDKAGGTNAELRWKNRTNNIVLGTDLESKTLESNGIAGKEQAIRKAGFYLNDTLSFSGLSVTPGIRHDYTSSNEDFTSPSLGITYAIADSTILRAYAARGFSIPPLSTTYGDNMFITANPYLRMERVNSYQAGAETALKYIWAKASAFRHDIRGLISVEQISGFQAKVINRGRQRRQGMEAQIRTAPFHGASVTAGAEYISARDLDTDLILREIPKNIYDLGLLYEVPSSFSAYLRGRYINWNTEAGSGASDNSFVFDLNIIKVLFANPDSSLDIFTTVHNLFNNSQYALPMYKNPDRWAEAGIRYKF